jgi:plasmid stabilization system protein ParE
MSYSYKVREEAVSELVDTVIWYEKRKAGLGILFKTKFYDKLDLICNNPLHYKASYKKYHEALTDQFPFLIVYTIDEKIMLITVIAVFHTSRNPREKLKRTRLK